MVDDESELVVIMTFAEDDWLEHFTADGDLDLARGVWHIR
jgi:hypothetical protein